MSAEVLSFNQMKNAQKNVGRDIYVALNYLGKGSKKTFTEYERDTKKFFGIMRNKTILDLNEQDLAFTRQEIISYQRILRDNPNNLASKKYAGNSINRMIKSVKSLFKELQVGGYNVDHELFSIKGESISDVKKHPFVTWEQIENDILPAVRYTNFGDKKALLIEFACVTSFRLDSIIKGISMSNSFKRKNGVIVAEVLGKGSKWDRKSIPEDLWSRMQELFCKYKSDSLFQFSETTITRMMDHIRRTTNINVTFHSFKKCGIREVKNITGNDMKAMQEQGAHESFATTMNYYDEFNEDFSKKPSLLIGQKIDTTLIDNLSHDELLDAIKSDRGLQFALLSKVKNLP